MRAIAGHISFSSSDQTPMILQKQPIQFMMRISVVAHLSARDRSSPAWLIIVSDPILVVCGSDPTG